METEKVVANKIDIPEDMNRDLKIIGVQEDKSKKTVMLEAMAFYIQHKKEAAHVES